MVLKNHIELELDPDLPVSGVGPGRIWRSARSVFAVVLKKSYLPLFAGLIAVASICFGFANAAEEVVATEEEPTLAFSARLVADATRARIVVDFVSEPDFAVRYLAGPPRILVELPPTTFGFKPDTLQARGLVTSIRYGDAGRGRARLVLQLAGPASLEIARVEPIEGGGGFRLLLDAVSSTPEVFAELVESSDWKISPKGARAAGRAVLTDKPFTLVIDPGHGGIDGGAEGGRGTKEKEVTLAFAKDLADHLKSIDDMRVVLTRKDDNFISLSGRLRMAHEVDADLFISLHADSIAIRRVRGATVYTLSDKASDAVAASLAAQESPNDAMVGEKLEEAPESVAGILVDLARNETRVFSSGLAEQIVRNFEGQVRLINNPHRQAGFRVLQSPDLPAALVELGYLSNLADEKLLADEAWRRKAAALLAGSIETYRERISLVRE